MILRVKIPFGISIIFSSAISFSSITKRLFEVTAGWYCLFFIAETRVNFLFLAVFLPVFNPVFFWGVSVYVGRVIYTCDGIFKLLFRLGTLYFLYSWNIYGSLSLKGLSYSKLILGSSGYSKSLIILQSLWIW